MPFCTTCGTDNSDTSTFCSNCGAKMEIQSSKTMDTQPPSKGMDAPSYTEDPQYQQGQPQYQQGQPQYQQGQPQYQQGQPQYQQGQLQYPPQRYGYTPNAMGMRPPRTGWLTYVLVMNWIGVGFLVLSGIVIFSSPEEFQSDLGVRSSEIGTITIILILIAGLIAWLNIKLKKYNNTARVIALVLQILGFLGALGSFNPLSLVLGGLQIYALGFHKETVDLFKGVQQPYAR